MASDVRREFIRTRREFWRAALTAALGERPEASTTLTDPSAIQRTIRHFAIGNYNHTLLPGGGGLDAEGVGPARERGRLSIDFGERTCAVFLPRTLTIEYFGEDPIESFLLLEMAEQEPTGVDDRPIDGREDLIDTGDGRYRSRHVWGRGDLGEDSYGNEIPLPEDTQLVSRYLRGKMLILSKGSWWNSQPATYDGRHNHMSAEEIRRGIETRTLAPYGRAPW